jgi:hypothetical protein
MRTLSTLTLLAAGALLLPVGAVSAGDPGSQRTSTRDQHHQGRAVLVCETDAATRRAFTREYGAPPVFVTAREALATSPSDPAWEAPRCMTAREHARYAEAANTYARAVR